MCIKEERRAVIRFFSTKGVKPAKSIRCKQAQYDDRCLSQSKIYKWIERFKQGRTSLCVDERSSCPSTSTTEGRCR
ncbi:hypothetical protein TNCV_1529851 [Trichonephila clavipes]|uniref:Mos1 transposase HTH domain-containing protein n=1 Tax=Trichonephila clavipes TaxID=2585209 RepID=A0A8X6SRR3_TRICX|nr:hypothetical protein TNCV_1529851 [Trichonephila clavipes]